MANPSDLIDLPTPQTPMANTPGYPTLEFLQLVQQIKDAIDEAGTTGSGFEAVLYDDRATLAAADVPLSVDIVRTGGYHAAGDQGGAAYKRAGAEPLHALKVQSADGAWWELVPESHGYINVRQAGAKGDDATDDGQAFIDALAFASLNATSNDNATYGVVVPPGNFYLGANTLELKATVHLLGQGSGQASVKPSILRWDANVTGIIVHRHNTIGATTEASSTQLSADGSIIQGLHLKSGGGTIAAFTDDTKGNGVWLRARAVLQDLYIQGFPGNGVNIVATAGGAANREGNANNWQMNRLRIIQCHLSGVYVDGADVNNGTAIGVDCAGNGRWGIWDSSFLGSLWAGCHTATNGIASVGENTATESSIVTFGGNRYCADWQATEAQLVATTPGTDETIWHFIEAGGVGGGIITWVASQPAGTYFVGGSYLADNANARTFFAKCYTEGGQGSPQIVSPASIVGGNMEGYIGSASALIGDVLRGSLESNNHDLFTSSLDLTVKFQPAADKLLRLEAEGDHSGQTNLVAWDNTNKQWLIGEHANSSGRRPIRLTTDLNTQSYGRSAALSGGQIAFHQGIYIGASQNRVRWFGGMNSKPTAGERGRGDLEFNYNPTGTGQALGWRCITAGTIGSGGALEDLYAAPDLPTDRGAVLKPHASAASVEWAAAPKAGTDTIADTASTQAVTFATAFSSANYSVGIAADGNETIWITSKATTGFTLNRAGTSGARAVDWTATPHEDR